MIFQEFDFYRVLAGIISVVLGFLQPYVTPVGEFMVGWVAFLLQFFPTDDLSVYFVIFIFFIIMGAIVNSNWPGDKLPATFEKKGESIDDSVEKCKDCGNVRGNEKICPFCGSV